MSPLERWNGQVRGSHRNEEQRRRSESALCRQERQRSADSFFRHAKPRPKALTSAQIKAQIGEANQVLLDLHDKLAEAETTETLVAKASGDVETAKTDLQATRTRPERRRTR